MLNLPKFKAAAVQAAPVFLDTDATVDKVHEKMALANTTLALHCGAIVGCIFDELQEDFLYFFSLAVLPAYRRLTRDSAVKRGHPCIECCVCAGMPRQKDLFEAV